MPRLESYEARLEEAESPRTIRTEARFASYGLASTASLLVGSGVILMKGIGRYACKSDSIISKESKMGPNELVKVKMRMITLWTIKTATDSTTAFFKTVSF